MEQLVYTNGLHEIYWSKVNNNYYLESPNKERLWSNKMDVLVDQINKRNKEEQQLQFDLGDIL